MFKRNSDALRYERNKQSYNAACAKRTKTRRFNLMCAVKSGPCSECGRLLPPWMLDFDHRDPSNKVCTVSSLLSKGRMTPELQSEVAKCDLICAVCHGYRTLKQYGQPTEADQEFFRVWVRSGSSYAGAIAR